MTQEKTLSVTCPKCGEKIKIYKPIQVEIKREGSVKLPRTEGMKRMIRAWLEKGEDIIIDNEGLIWGFVEPAAD